MPELPEVETVVQGLKRKILNKTIQKVSIYYDKIIEYPSTEEFSEKIQNQTIHDIKRYGKWIIFILDTDYLLSHLRMEGKYFIKEKNAIHNKHEHVTFLFTNNEELRYHDVRKFGKMLLIPKDKIAKIGPLKEMGKEPWDKTLTNTYLEEKLKKKSIPIKSSLLDQSIIVGIGNIYADEILFSSNINPLKKSNTLTSKERQAIINNTRKILEKAIEKGGTTIRSYTSVNGVHGLFQQELSVHGKENQPCPICKSKILKIKVAGRGTYYCPHCQK